MRFNTICLISVVACVLAASLGAQGAPDAEAASLIKRLTQRSSLPPVAARAEIDAATVKVCQALGRKLRRLPIGTATTLANYLAESSNENARAALLTGLAAERPEVALACLGALTSLEFSAISRLRAGGEALEPGIFEQLQQDDCWRPVVREQVTALCSVESGSTEDDTVRHRQIALALIVDTYAGEEGYGMMLDAMIDLLVGEPTDVFLKLENADREVDEDRKDEKNKDDKKDKDKDANDLDVDALRNSKLKLMAARRKRASVMYELLMIEDVETRQFGRSFSYNIRVEAAKRLRKAIEAGEIGTWRSWLLGVSSDADLEEGQRLRAVVRMDELVGGTRLMPKGHTAGDTDEEGMLIEEVPVFLGDQEKVKIEQFLSLDTREKRRRIRKVRRAFREQFGSG